MFIKWILYRNQILVRNLSVALILLALQAAYNNTLVSLYSGKIKEVLSINQLQHLIQQELEQALLSATAAAKRAHETATDTESIAKSKYETFGLEASYLAHGQSVRVAQCQADIRDFEALFTRLNDMSDTNVTKVGLGKLVELVDSEGNNQYLFVGPSAGGLKVTCDKHSVMVVTLAAPLGRAMMSKVQGDEFSLLVAGSERNYEIVMVS